MMSLKVCFWIGPFQLSGRNQKYTGKVNLHILTTHGGLLEYGYIREMGRRQAAKVAQLGSRDGDAAVGSMANMW